MIIICCYRDMYNFLKQQGDQAGAHVAAQVDGHFPDGKNQLNNDLQVRRIRRLVLHNQQSYLDRIGKLREKS